MRILECYGFITNVGIQILCSSRFTLLTNFKFVLLQRRAVRILWGIPLFSEDLHTSTKSKLNSSKLEPKQTLEFKSEKEICDFSLIYWFLLVNWLWIFFIYSCNLFAALTSSVEDSLMIKYIPERTMADLPSWESTVSWRPLKRTGQADTWGPEAGQDLKPHTVGINSEPLCFQRLNGRLLNGWLAFHHKSTLLFTDTHPLQGELSYDSSCADK